MTEIRWAQPAVDDLRDIAQYIAAESQGAAGAFVDRADKAVRQLGRHPLSGRIVPELQRHNISQYRELVLSPWRLFYRYEQDVAVVLAVIDGRRNVEDVLLRRLTRPRSSPGDSESTKR